MYDQFDKRLSERIKYVFDLYEDDSSGIGWKKLRKNLPGSKDNRRPLVYWLSVAAAVLLLLGTWAYLKRDQDVVLISKAPSKTVQKQQATENYASEDQQTAKKQLPVHLPVNSVAGRRMASLKETASSFKESAKPAANEALINAETRPLAVAKPSATHLTVAQQKDSTLKEPVYARQNSPTTKDPVSAQQPVEEKSPVDTREEQIRLQGEKLARLSVVTDTKSSKERKAGKLSFGVFAGTYFNYSEGSKSGMNTGAGLSSEIAVTKKLKLSTGISIAQNTLKYEKMIPEQAAAVFLAKPSSGEALLATSLQAKTSSLNYSINGYDASLLGLDVPVNIKYMLLEKKKDLYVVAGISSNFFIDEAYTYNYEYNTNDNSADAYKNEKTSGNNSSFDFARMLNLSVGFGYPVGRQSKLSFEPFVKYPLGGLGTQNIRFGSAGLNLKLNFSTR